MVQSQRKVEEVICPDTLKISKEEKWSISDQKGKGYRIILNNQKCYVRESMVNCNYLKVLTIVKSS